MPWPHTVELNLARTYEHMDSLDVAQLGQVFTPEAVVKQMLALRRNQGRTLEPAAGNGAFSQHIDNCISIEIDPRVAKPGAWVIDFFSYPDREKFSTVIGNPPYVRYQDIRPDTKGWLNVSLFDARSNLYLFFIEKAIRHLEPGGELIFIVPREFVKLTSARNLNALIYEQGTITDFIETGDSKIFDGAVPNCAIFRFEKGRMDRTMNDGRVFTLVNGQLMFLSGRYTVPFSDVFQCKVGAVSGADNIFTHPEGNAEFVCSHTRDTGETRRMFFGVNHKHLQSYKQSLISRRIRQFDESNWWQWGRLHHMTDAPRIYVNQKTRRKEPFFLHPCKNYDGSVLALFPKDPSANLDHLVSMLNNVNWDELGFVCDGRFLFGQRALQTCLLPDSFTQGLPNLDRK